MTDNVQAINDALFKEKNVDEEALINITKTLKHKERAQVSEQYKAKFGKELTKDFEDKLGGDLRDAMKSMYTDFCEYAADEVYKAMKGVGCDDDTLISVLATKPLWYNKKIMAKFQEKYGKDMLEEIKSETSGDFKTLLVNILTTERSTNSSPNADDCKAIAQELYNAGEAKLGTDEAVFIKYFTTASPQELAVIAREYHKISTKYTLYGVIEDEFSGAIRNLLLTLLYCLVTPTEYFASQISKAVDRAGTDEALLNRTLILRSEKDMKKIIELYQKLKDKDMIETVKDDVSGNYLKLVSYLMGEE